MSEFDEVRERRKQFLKAAYDLVGPRKGNIVGMEEVAQEMGVQWNVLERNNELDAYAAYYGGKGGGKGFIKSQADSFGIFSASPQKV